MQSIVMLKVRLVLIAECRQQSSLMSGTKLIDQKYGKIVFISLPLCAISNSNPLHAIIFVNVAKSYFYSLPKQVSFLESRHLFGLASVLMILVSPVIKFSAPFNCLTGSYQFTSLVRAAAAAQDRQVPSRVDRHIEQSSAACAQKPPIGDL